MKASEFLVVVLILEVFATAQMSGSQAAASALRKSSPTVSWSVGSATTADVDCDGKPDTIMLGSEKGKVVVGVVWGSPAKPPQILVFPVSAATQDGFCSN